MDEFIVVAGDSTDNTDELLASIDSPKVRIIKNKWDMHRYPGKGMIFAYQTDIALQACTGDWCLYLQSDEVLHENGLPLIRRACEKYLNDMRVDGFLLSYVHLYADYEHVIEHRHFAYPREIRIVRGGQPDLHSWRDAQSFRYIKDFDYKDYWQKENTRKLNCILLDAYVFHYGWSRDPRCMVKKTAFQNSAHEGRKMADVDAEAFHDYGNISMMPKFTGTHPAVMRERISKMSWRHLLREDGPRPDIRKLYGLKNRTVQFIEKYLMRKGDRMFGFKNYNLIGRMK